MRRIARKSTPNEGGKCVSFELEESEPFCGLGIRYLQRQVRVLFDLIIIVRMIFVISEERPDRIVRPEEVEDVLTRFETDHSNHIHADIR